MPLADATREKAYAAEKGIAAVRVAVIALNSAVYHLYVDKAATHAPLAYAIILAANAYGLVVLVGKPYRRFPVMMSSLFTTASDAGLIALWIFATGGIASPFYPLWQLSLAAVAFRFGARETAFATGLYAASDLALLAASGHLAGRPGDILVREGYILLTGAVGVLIARETFTQTREKVQMRDLAALLRESEERFRRLSDATFEGIAIHEGGRIVEVNRAFADMLGRAPSELVGATPFDFVHPDDHDVIRDRLRHLRDTPYEVRGVRRDGTVFDMELVGRDIPYRGGMARVTAVRDVTERRLAERSRAEREALALQNQRLQEVDRLKTQFVNNAAHELGTPLTPIKLQTHLLRNGSLGPLTERQEKALRVVARNVDHLGALVKDVLDSSRVQAGRLTLRLEEVDAAELLRESVESFADPASEAGVTLRLEAPPSAPIQADRVRLTQVAYNLLSNALKFTPPGGEVAVRLTADDELLRVEVRDTGAGLAAEDIPRLFQPFSQVHDKMQRTRSGTGLGLYISKGIVEGHGGRLGCVSDGPGRGSTFFVELPRAPPSLRVEVAPEKVE